MAMVFKCDRCGEIFNRKVPDINECYGTANSILFLDCTVERNRFGLGEEPIQLCPSCMKELNDWLEPNKEKLDNGNKNEWNNMTTQPQCGVAPPRKDGLQMWRNKSDVTSEAIEAVMGHFIMEMERDDKNKVQKAWGVRGGKTLKVTFEISIDKEKSNE